jgi:drug/metabolite transporter (DMT)-like permease
MIFSHAGELAALGTACCWTVTALCFEAASRRVGSLTVNLVRLLIAMVFLSLYCWIMRGHALPFDASRHNWYWLIISGTVGLFLGDLCLFRAFVLIGARRSMLIMSLAPPLTAIAGWVVMEEWLSILDWAGMALTVGGVSWVVMERSDNSPQRHLKTPFPGIVFALLAAMAQAVGLVLSKFGMEDYDPFAANQIRIIAAAAGFLLLATILRWWPRVGRAIQNRPAMGFTTIGAFFGTFLGISLSLVAVQLTNAGVAATIISIVPILIIPPAMFFFRERVTLRSVLGAALAVAGVALLFL